MFFQFFFASSCIIQNCFSNRYDCKSVPQACGSSSSCFMSLYAKPYQNILLHLKIFHSNTFFFKHLATYVCDTVNLANSRMFVSKSKLMVYYEIFFFNIWFKHLRRSFSKSFDMLGSSNIGLYEIAHFGSLHGFSSIITCAYFHCLGK